MLRLNANAKINLSLKILGLRPDGYHELESIMQSVSLHDTLTLTPIVSGIELTTSNLRLPVDSRNLAYKAADLYYKSVSDRALPFQGIKIHIEKQIPLAAGLAGGSANAAGVFYGINVLAGNPLSREELMRLGEQIGSDVPFCLLGGSCTVRGRGERVIRNTLSIDRSYIIVVPEVEVPTKWAYEAFDNQAAADARRFNTTLPNANRNDLEGVVTKKYPVIQKVKERLLALGCSFAQMSGSGASVFGIVKDIFLGQKIVAEMKKEFPKSFLVSSVGEGISLN